MNKNIHIIPTNKPTGIFESKNGLHFSIIEKIRYGEFKGFHIYITNDEEIKDGWSYDRMMKSIGKRDNVYSSKIILTTDPDLIANGVQAIDDDFLEWFVKNPSCEYIEVNYDVFEKTGNISVWEYDIIIPQEEPNPCKDIIINNKATVDVPFHNKYIRFENLTSEQAGYLLQISEFYQLNGVRRSAVVPQEEIKQIKCYCGHTITCDCEPLQETLEEAAEMYIQSKNPQWTPYHKQSFKDGAKWQQERMYSEEQVIILLQKYRYDLSSGKTANIGDTTKFWFEQFKKKFD
jgi:hypothetical protein